MTYNNSSSMETLPAEDICCSSSLEDKSHRTVWGRLLPMGKSFTAIDLSEEEYTFGRESPADIVFENPNKASGDGSKQTSNYQTWAACSKVHFRIFRKETSAGVFTFLEDKSSNGTFINGERVGKNKHQVLNTNDEIALPTAKRKAYIFVDPNANEEFPEELKNKYTVLKVLGRGTCGEVRLAFEKNSTNKVAIKIVQKKRFSMGGKKAVNIANEVMSEVNILRALKHPCIISIEDVIDTEDQLFIALEYIQGGELFDRIVKVGGFPENIAKLLFYQMVLAVKYLHDQGITHRDLKPENILLATDENETLVKVTDFGLSKLVDANTMLKTFCGTPNYLAPEIIKTAGNGEYTQVIDCWSLGVILFICLVGYPPFDSDRKDLSLGKQIVNGKYSFPKQYWNGISNEVIDLVKKLLCVNPDDRLTLTQALDHTWLQDEDMKLRANQLMHPAVDQQMLPPKSNMTPKKRPANEVHVDGNRNKTQKII